MVSSKDNEMMKYMTYLWLGVDSFACDFMSDESLAIQPDIYK